MTNENEQVFDLAVLEKEAPAGLVLQVVNMEAEAEVLAEKAKEINSRAKMVRELIMKKLRSAKLTSATHDSGWRATIVQRAPKIAVIDEKVAIKAIKKNKLVTFLAEVPEQVIPEHTEIRMDVLTSWVKSAGVKVASEMLSGIEIEQKDSLTIAKK